MRQYGYGSPESMVQKVLVIGGNGRIGRSVAADVLKYTGAQVTVTGRQDTAAFEMADRQAYAALDVTNEDGVERAIAQHDLTIHCAGPFRSRNHHVLLSCIAQGKPYLDVADSPDYVNKALTYRQAAQKAGVTAIISTGIFPGISGSDGAPGRRAAR